MEQDLKIGCFLFLFGLVLAIILLFVVPKIYGEWLKIEDMGKIDSVRIWGKDWELLTNGGLKPGKINSLHVFIRPQVGVDMDDKVIATWGDSVFNLINPEQDTSDTACWHWEIEVWEKTWWGETCTKEYHVKDKIVHVDTLYEPIYIKIYDDCDTLK